MPFNSNLIKYLENFSCYYYIKYNTILYRLLLQLRPGLRKSITKEKKLYQALLYLMPKKAIIFDIGASVGTTTKIFADLGAEVIAVEPARKNLFCLFSRFQANKKVRIVSKAISNQIGEAQLYEQNNGNTLHTLSNKWKDFLSGDKQNRWEERISFQKSIQVSTTTLDMLINEFGLPFLIKIDVEGLEWEVIQGLNHPIPIIIFEANLPEFLEETIFCVKQLTQIDQGAVFNYSDGESIVLAKPLKEEAFISLLKETPLRYLDIICYT